MRLTLLQIPTRMGDSLHPQLTPSPNRFIIKTTSKKPTAKPRAAAGLSIGCFAGAGYGLAVGIGHMRPFGRKSAVVTPSLSSTPFAHDGTIVGAFCGVMVGVGFASAVAFHIGYEWTLFRKQSAAGVAALQRRLQHVLCALRLRDHTHFR